MNLSDFLSVPTQLIAAASDGGGELKIGVLLMGLLGGLALFLYGMEKLSDSLKAVAGNRMRAILAGLTSNRIVGALTGALITAVIQSSSVTTVLVVGFISAGLMSLSQSIGVIMGANIGTTITAQIIAFKVTHYALLLVACGFGMMFLGRRERIKQWGAGVMGLGMVFLGMSLMGDAMYPLRESPVFLGWMTRLERPVIGILAGALFTGLVQSSSATTGIAIVLAAQGLITLPAGIALAFGANVGTCVTAQLASIGKPREAKRAAMVHIVFNVLGVMIWLPFINQLAALITWISPAAGNLEGMARLAAETPRQIANAHTLFNVVNTILFLPFATQLARIVERIIPDRPLTEADEVKARYLDKELLDTPSLALDRVRLEILGQGERVTAMLDRSLPALLDGQKEEIDELAKMDDAVDALHGQIVTYLGNISQSPHSEAETGELLGLLEAANSLENIGDIVETNLVGLGKQRIHENLTVSQATREVLAGFHQVVYRAVETAVQAVTQRNERAAHLVIDMKSEIQDLMTSAEIHQSRRLIAQEPNRLPAYTIEMDILQSLRRIYYFAKRMARGVVPDLQVEEAGYSESTESAA